jgi:hypothetical protein
MILSTEVELLAVVAQAVAVAAASAVVIRAAAHLLQLEPLSGNKVVKTIYARVLSLLFFNRDNILLYMINDRLIDLCQELC